MKFKFKLKKPNPSWLNKISGRRSGKIAIQLNADLGEESTFAVASNKKELKQLKKSDVDIVYHQKNGKFYFNGRCC